MYQKSRYPKKIYTKLKDKSVYAIEKSYFSFSRTFEEGLYFKSDLGYIKITIENFKDFHDIVYRHIFQHLNNRSKNINISKTGIIELSIKNMNLLVDNQFFFPDKKREYILNHKLFKNKDLIKIKYEVKQNKLIIKDIT